MHWGFRSQISASSVGLMSPLFVGEPGQREQKDGRLFSVSPGRWRYGTFLSTRINLIVSSCEVVGRID